MPQNNLEYTTVTEVPGNKATKENLQMLYSRYRWASQFVQGKEVLEVGCGPGIGLGYLAKKAKKIIGGDYDKNLVKLAKDYYQGKIEVLQLNAHNLPFKARTFDVVILFETIYYLKQPEKFLEECCRVLQKGGVLLISTVNKDWSGFNSSPFSFKYFSAKELTELLNKKNFKVQLLGGFPASANSIKDKIISVIRKTAVILRLIPKTMKGKEKLKKIFLGKLLTIPPEIKEGIADYFPPVPISANSPNLEYKVLYVIANPK